LKIELLYFDDCPNWINAKETLIETLNKLGVSLPIKRIAVETQEDAIRYKFTGSPTVRIDGDDLFPTDQENFAIGCRMYLTPEGYKGWPTEEMFLEKLRPLIEQD
jgi:hypothetical protein